jgi:FlaA1/EpsC-like NDP-sugar epimerase
MHAKADLSSAGSKVAVGLRPTLLLKAFRTALDVVGWITATLAAFALHYEGAIPVERWPAVLASLAVLTLLKLVATLVFEVNRQSWEKLSFRDARNVLFASGSVVLAATLVLRTVGSGLGIPVAIPVIDGMLTALFMVSSRGLARYINETRIARASPGRKLRRVLLVGAGEAGSMLAREMLRHPETGMRPVAFIDDDHSKAGRTIAGVPVLGRLDDIAFVLDNEAVDEVLITIPSADGRAIRDIVERVRQVSPGIAYRTMPALHELLSGQVTINRIREVGIEDLLRRPTVQLDTDSILSYLQGKRVMVTGAGGSIGSELVRQICRFGPHELILFGHGENSIYQLERELDLTWPDVRYTSVIAAVQNTQRLDYVFRRYRPDVVFHTAAHKHVPLMELNPEEAVFNNIIGTRNLVRLALAYGVTHFVNISTDKAVHPTSVMGASKRIAELLVEDAARDAGEGQVFVSVRFGNVLGSRGSAVPIFKQQIQVGGPVTVTHPDMMRYFMTIPEASRLVLQASGQGKNGEVYILDMGEPIRVLDLVKDLIRLSGLEPEIDIPIVFTGVRPGEKLVEELMTEAEEAGGTEHDKIFVARPHPVSRAELEQTVNALQEAALHSDGDEIRKILAGVIDGSNLLPLRSPGAPVN